MNLKGTIIPHGQPDNWYHLIEDEAQSFPRGMVNLIGGELDVDDPRLRTNWTSQSLQHCSVGYHPYHTNDLATKAYPCNCNQEHKQKQKMQSNKLDYEMGSHKPKNGDTVQWQIDSKQNPKTLMWRWLLYIKYYGTCKSSGRNPKGFQHGTWANGPTDGETAPW
jgi:hypothetical protein